MTRKIENAKAYASKDGCSVAQARQARRRWDLRRGAREAPRTSATPCECGARRLRGARRRQSSTAIGRRDVADTLSSKPSRPLRRRSSSEQLEAPQPYASRNKRQAAGRSSAIRRRRLPAQDGASRSRAPSQRSRARSRSGRARLQVSQGKQMHDGRTASPFLHVDHLRSSKTRGRRWCGRSSAGRCARRRTQAGSRAS